MPVRCAARVLVIAGVLVAAAPGVVSAQAVDDPYYQFLLARHLESEGDMSGALAALQRAAAADPGSAEIQAEIALLQYRRNQHDEAEKAAKAALALDIDNVEANRVLGFLYTNAAQNERATPAQRVAYLRDAISHLERVAAQGSPDLTVVSMLGRLYLTTGQNDKAVERLTEAVVQNPFSFDARRVLAMAYGEMKDFRSAIAVLQDLASEEPRVHALIGDYQVKGGEFAEAADSFTRALAVQPGSRELKENRILALYESEQYEKAATAAADAQRQHPDYPGFPAYQAQALYKDGNEGRAIELLESAVSDFPRDITVRYTLADLYKESGRTGDAEQMLRQILQINPSHPDALNYLGYLLALNGTNLDEAISLVSRALEARPNNGAYLDSLGWAYFRRGDLNEAEKYLGQAVDRMPGNSEVLDHMGDVHAAQGRWQDAINIWSQALRGNGDGIDPAAVKKKIEDARSRLAR